MKTTHEHIGNVEKWFDSTADYWEQLYRTSNLPADKVLVERRDLAVNFASKYLKPGQRILDAGCGAGVIALELAQRGFQVHGIDIAEKMIQLCNKNFEEAKVKKDQYKFTVGSLMDTQLPDGTFDGILALGVLEYQPDEKALLQAFYRLLRPGGILIVTGPNDQTTAGKVYSKGRRLLKRMRRKISSPTRNPGKKPGKAAPGISLNIYTVARFDALLRSNGFSLMEQYRHGYANVPIISKFLGAYRPNRTQTNPAPYLFLNRFANDIVVVGKKQSAAR